MTTRTTTMMTNYCLKALSLLTILLLRSATTANAADNDAISIGTQTIDRDGEDSNNIPHSSRRRRHRLMRGTAENDDGEEEMNRKRLLREQELSPGTRIIAKYKSPRGHRLVESCARKIILDDDDDDDENEAKKATTANNNKVNDNFGMITIEGNGDCLHLLQDDPDIEEADFDFPVHLLSTSSSSSMIRGEQQQKQENKQLEDRALRDRESLPWGLEMINADRLEKGEHDILVCMVDTGIAQNHPDFDQSQIDGADSETYYRESWRWDSDPVGHGTQVAGVMATVSDNNIGIRGPGLNIFVTRAMDDEGAGHESDVRKAVEQCVEAGANIINLSIGGYGSSRASERYYRSVVQDMGIMMIAAAGNDGSNDNVYPASDPNVISVAGVTQSGDFWQRSNYGNQIEFAAPAGRVLTTNVVTSTIQVPDGHIVEGHHIGGTSTENVASKLVYCSFGHRSCNGAEGNICLMFRLNRQQTVESILESCEVSGGIGAIIFGDYDTSAWTVSASSDIIYIPAIAISWNDGYNLMGSHLDETVVIGANTDGNGEAHTFGYDYASGTSFAAPHVTVAAALVWSHFGSVCSNHQIRYALAASTTRMSLDESSDDGGCDQRFGHGIVDAEAAYYWLLVHDCRSWDVPEVSRGGCTTLQGGPIY